MSDADVRLVLRVFDAINRRDVGAVLDAYEPDAQMVTLTSSFLQDSGYEGHEGIKDYFSSMVDVWQDLTLSPEETTDLDGHVLVQGHWRSRGKGSGAEVNAPAAWLFTIAGGKISDSRTFRDVDEALAALNAAEPDVEPGSALPSHPPTTS